VAVFTWTFFAPNTGQMRPGFSMEELIAINRKQCTAQGLNSRRERCIENIYTGHQADLFAFTFIAVPLIFRYGA
jgi:hypothetical protein